MEKPTSALSCALQSVGDHMPTYLDQCFGDSRMQILMHSVGFLPSYFFSGMANTVLQISLFISGMWEWQVRVGPRLFLIGSLGLFI